MSKRRKTPAFVQRCVRAVAKRHDGDVSRGFAICVKQYQDNGMLQKGTITPTKKGEEYASMKSSLDDHAEKIKEYNRLLKKAAKGRKVQESIERVAKAQRQLERSLKLWSES